MNIHTDIRFRYSEYIQGDKEEKFILEFCLISVILE